MSQYVYQWSRGMPMPSVRAAEARSLSDYPGVIYPGAPERGAYDEAPPLGIYPTDLTRAQQVKILLVAAAVGGVALWFFLRKKKRAGGSMVGKTLTFRGRGPVRRVAMNPRRRRRRRSRR